MKASCAAFRTADRKARHVVWSTSLATSIRQPSMPILDPETPDAADQVTHGRLARAELGSEATSVAHVLYPTPSSRASCRWDHRTWRRCRGGTSPRTVTRPPCSRTSTKGGHVAPDVIEDAVEDEAHAAGPERRDATSQREVPAEARIDREVVGGVVLGAPTAQRRWASGTAHRPTARRCGRGRPRSRRGLRRARSVGLVVDTMPPGALGQRRTPALELVGEHVVEGRACGPGRDVGLVASARYAYSNAPFGDGCREPVPAVPAGCRRFLEPNRYRKRADGARGWPTSTPRRRPSRTTRGARAVAGARSRASDV